MAKYKLEYIWLDGYKPVPNLRGKTLVKDFDSFPSLEQLPNWGFDGSSTQQAEGHNSDCVLKPVARYLDTTRVVSRYLATGLRTQSELCPSACWVELPSKPQLGSCSKLGKLSKSLTRVFPRRLGTGL